MLKALLKKQWLETLALFSLSGKKEGKRSKFGTAGLALLLVYALVASFFTTYELTKEFCAPLVQNGLAWVYFSLIGLISLTFSCVGTVFMAKARLFEAKDNETLLAMPIPTWAILFSRMLSLYLFSLLFIVLLFLPAVIQYFVVAGFQLVPALCIFLILPVLPLGSVAISGLLGWIVAMVISRLKAKNLVTILVTGAFLVLYFYAYSQIADGLEYLLAHGEAVGEALKTGVYPLWQMGLAATGDWLALAIFTLIFGGAFALVYFLISKTFLYILTTKRGEIKPEYKERAHTSRSSVWAIVVKEIHRFTNNMMVGLNALMGSLLLLILPLVALFNAELLEMLTTMGTSADTVGAILSVVLGFIGSSNVLTACSISLEGESLWVLRSMPVRTEEVFKGKIFAHLLLTMPFLAVSGTILCILLQIPVWTAIAVLLMPFTMVFLTATLGLLINLKCPNLHWTNELAAVKQSLSTLAAMLTGLGVGATTLGGWFWFGKYLGAWYLVIMTLVFLLAGGLVCLWLAKRGKSIFENL